MFPRLSPGLVHTELPFRFESAFGQFVGDTLMAVDAGLPLFQGFVVLAFLG